MIVHGALEAAVRSRLVRENVAKRVNNKPRAAEANVALLSHCWTAEEAATFLVAAKAAGPQPAAFFTPALDSGARKAELCGLRWSDFDTAQGRLTIQRQLLIPGRTPLGLPLQMNNLGQREYARIIKAADVRPIKFHGLRHTCATLLLSAGVPAHVVAQRLGRKRVEITLGIYGRVLGLCSATRPGD